MVRLALALFVTIALGRASLLAQEGLALVGGIVYVDPAAEPIRNGVVLIRGGRITAVGGKSLRIPAHFQILNCTGKAITAGFWNSHVHFFERKWADAAEIPAAELTQQLDEMFTRFGFTNAFDLGSPWQNTRRIRDRVASGEAGGPAIRSTGEVLIAPGAMPPANILGILGDMPLRNFEVTTPDETTGAVQALVAKGVDGIKIHLQPPPSPNKPMSQEVISTAVIASHDAKKLVFVHPNSGADLLSAIRMGIDVVAHTTPSSGPWDPSIPDALRGRKIALAPTLSLWQATMRHDRVSSQNKLVDIAVGQLRAWQTAGGTVLFGTDLGAVGYDPTDEYVLMSRAGLSFRQILASLTVSPAALFGDAQTRGRIATGFIADLVVLDGDPSRDITKLAAVAYTVEGGRIAWRARRP